MVNYGKETPSVEPYNHDSRLRRIGQRDTGFLRNDCL